MSYAQLVLLKRKLQDRFLIDIEDVCYSPPTETYIHCIVSSYDNEDDEIDMKHYEDNYGFIFDDDFSFRIPLVRLNDILNDFND
jgi:hypothetical protein